MKRLFAALGLAALVATAPAVAGPYEDGAAAHVRGDYAEAALLYRIAANAGEVRAMVALAGLYGEGRGVVRDYAEALRWYAVGAGAGARGEAVHRMPRHHAVMRRLPTAHLAT